MPVGPSYSQADFQQALQNLCPRGRIWPRDPDSVQFAFWNAMAGTWFRNANAAIGLLNDSPAFALDQMLPEWQETLGLPDACAPAGQTTQQEVAAVVAKFSAMGGQSAEYFINLADSIGYTDVTMTMYAPARCGRSHCGDPCGRAEWYFAWLVTAPNVPIIYAQCGIAHCGDPLWYLEADELECTIEKYAPAHTVVLFSGHA